MQAIHHVFTIAATPARVYDALTTAEGLSGWWTTDVRGDGSSPGGVIDFRFGGDFDPDMRVTALEPERRVTWEHTGGHTNWDGSTFEFQLEGTQAGTLVRFWQHYGRQLSDDDYGVYNYNWGYYLESLRLLCETGKGKPYQPEQRISATSA
jgi:uncharacterized protein YndB with AHSA1/START domain